jgi:hypothetical protein
MQNASCALCNRLRRDYAAATSTTVQLKVELAEHAYDSGRYQFVELAAEAAEQHQESLRQQIAEHEASHGMAGPAAQLNKW